MPQKEVIMGSTQPQIIWDQGTGYDFLASLAVLHFPDKFGLRGAWAAGVRSRIPGEERDFLEEVVANFPPPLRWVHSLPAPKDAAAVLLSLKQIPAAERISALQFCPVDSPELKSLLHQVMAQQAYTPDDIEEVMRVWRKYYKDQKIQEEQIIVTISRRRAETVLRMFANPQEFGERYYEALAAYYDVFFSEEEKRITPKLEQALAKGQKLAGKYELVKVLNKLLDGDWDESLLDLEELILVPSYWYSPWSETSCLQPERTLLLYGSRPKEESLVPGEIVPDDLMEKLKAMTDPTRLRILRYLMQEQLTPAELARRLRLRAPTVTHHLHTLKAAGMVHFVMRGKHEHLYFAKMDSIKGTYSLLKDFLEQDVSIAEGIDLLDDTRLY
jgi:DNA-binding transcriptional ArsR family regulator